jgi:hypothetical protein
MKISEQPEYQIWASMKQRCYNTKKKNYPNYGGRGITVCEQWVNSYSKFIQDMGRRPSDEYSIGRINNDGNYEPSNCKWELPDEQNYNKRTTAEVNTGDKFGKLTVLHEVEGKIRATNLNSVRRYFRVICECGIEKDIRMDKLRQRKNQSCGNRSCNKYAPIEN